MAHKLPHQNSDGRGAEDQQTVEVIYIRQDNPNVNYILSYLEPGRSFQVLHMHGKVEGCSFMSTLLKALLFPVH